MTSIVVPANAGTHTPRPLSCAHLVDGFANHKSRWLWVPAFAGTTIDLPKVYRRSPAMVRFANESRSAITDTK